MRKPAQLITLTGNLLAETTVYYHQAAWGKTQRAYSENFQVGGKGVNVARMAQRLGMRSEAWCFTGGFIGHQCRHWLEQQAFAVRSFELGAENRAGWVIRVNGVPGETTFLGQDRLVPIHVWQTACEELKEHRPAWVCICGSVPGWDRGFNIAMEDSMAMLQTAGVRFALDSYGPPLADGMLLPFDLVKINADEWRQLALTQHWHDDPITGLPVAMRELPVKRWVITDGDGPTLLADRTSGAIYRLHPPHLAKVASPVGSGDVTLGALLVHVERGLDWPGALAEAMRYGAANAAHEGVAAFALKRATELPLPVAERIG